MYRAISEIVRSEDDEGENSIEFFGISDGKGLSVTFTDSRAEAEKFVDLCNENEVEENQIHDLIEDCFYS